MKGSGKAKNEEADTPDKEDHAEIALREYVEGCGRGYGKGQGIGAERGVLDEDQAGEGNHDHHIVQSSGSRSQLSSRSISTRRDSYGRAVPGVLRELQAQRDYRCALLWPRGP